MIERAQRIHTGGWLGSTAMGLLTRGYYNGLPSTLVEPDISGTYPFGLRDIRLVSGDGLYWVDLPAGQTLTWTERLVSKEVTGRYGVVGVDTALDVLDWNLEAGGISLQAYSLLLGATVNTSGLSPNRRQTMPRSQGNVVPTIKIYGRALGAGSEAIWMLLRVCTVTTLDGDLTGGSFYVTKCAGLAVRDANGIIYDLIKLETDEELPTV